MYYLANWRIDNAGQIILPGIVFEGDFSEEQENRLLKLGAIVRTGDPELVNEIDENAPGIPLSQGEAGATGGDTEEHGTQEQDDEKPEEAPQNGAEDEAAEEDEADDDAPVPVIDVSEGVVEAPEPAKKKNTGRGKK